MIWGLLISLGGAPPPRTIYLIMPNDTPWQKVSIQFLNGFYMAVDDSVPFIIMNEDEAIPYDTFYINLIESKEPFIVIGPFKQENALISADISMRRRVINILPIAYDVRLGTYGNYVYPFNYKYYAMIMRFASITDTNFVLMYEDNTFGKSVKLLFDRMFSVPTIALKKGYFKKDEIKELLKDIRGYKSIFFSNSNIPSLNTYLTLRKWGFKGKVYVFDRWLDEDVISLLIGMDENVFVFALKKQTFSSYLMKLDKIYAFEEKYYSIYNEPPTRAAKIGYDTGILIASLYSSCKDVDCVKDNLLHYGIFYGISDNYLISKKLDYINIISLQSAKR